MANPESSNHQNVQSPRVNAWSPALGLLGLLAAVAMPLSDHTRMREAEQRAAGVLTAIQQAQEAFRAGAGAGQGGYASQLDSLTTACPGESRPALAAQADGSRVLAPGYEVGVRPAEDARLLGADCHQRPVVSNYYVAARPRINGVDGRQALAMTAEGRIFVFFDGVAPRETDMAPGGLAVPLDTLSSFKIP